MAFLGMFTKYQFITWEHKKCYWTSWYYRGYKKSITEQIQIARRKLGQQVPWKREAWRRCIFQRESGITEPIKYWWQGKLLKSLHVARSWPVQQLGYIVTSITKEKHWAQTFSMSIQMLVNLKVKFFLPKAFHHVRLIIHLLGPFTWSYVLGVLCAWGKRSSKQCHVHSHKGCS